MKLIIECECGNRMEVKPETAGEIAYFNRELINHDFHIGDQFVDVDLMENIVDDVGDVETKIKELRIDCDKCGQFMVLDCD